MTLTTPTTTTPATLATLLMSNRIAAIDHLMADSILDRLGFTLQDLSLDYGDIAIEDGEISHQLWYDSIDSTCTIMGYVYRDNDIYCVSGKSNYYTAQQAALELLDATLVDDCRYTIELERAMAEDYD